MTQSELYKLFPLTEEWQIINVADDEVYYENDNGYVVQATVTANRKFNQSMPGAEILQFTKRITKDYRNWVEVT